LKHLLLFDGACGLCTRAAALAKRIDRRSRFAIEPYQAYTGAELARYGLTYSDCSRKLQAVTDSGRVHSGAFAVNYFLWHQFPWAVLVAIIYALPVLLLLELAAYRLVAANRGRLSTWFRLPPQNRGRPTR
jgi:predicted DCC family thiol-disulfide oxidoreductase YuxK